MQRYLFRLSAPFAVLTLVLLAACGGGQSTLVPAADEPSGPVAAAQNPAANGWPAGLPDDQAAPWETVDSNGFVVPGGRSTAGVNLDTDFTPGIERHDEGGSFADNGEATTLVSGSAGSGAISWSQYRITLGGIQPGTVSADINLRPMSDGAPSEYWLGLSDFANETWEWQGPFRDNHVRVNLAGSDYLNFLGNMFVTVVAHDGADFDIVGVGVNTRDDLDTTAPPVPGTPLLTPVDNGLLVEWVTVVAGDLAGYIIYYRGATFSENPTDNIPRTMFIEGNTRHLLTGLDGMQYVRVAAVDVSGNESEASEIASATPLAGAPTSVSLTTDSVSGMVGDVINLTATGADTYDFDLDGDGVYEITGNLTGLASVSTSSSGVVRPNVRGTSGGTSVALGAVSLILSTNSRPVANAYASPASGIAPMDVTFGANAWDFDGTVTEFWWDLNGDSTWDFQYVAPDGPNPPPQTYAEAGTYNAKLRVYDDQGSWDVDTITINVKRPGQWESVIPDFSSGSGYQASTAIVDGHPAVAYFHTGPSFLMYVRAEDKYGSSWGTPMAIVAAPGAGQFSDLEVIDGKPAVAYFHGGPGEIQYIRADDATGSSWTNPPVTLEVAGTWEDVSLAYVNGNPAVAYMAAGELHYIRADSAAGTGDTPADWGSPPVIVDPSGTVGGYASLAVINGHPAIGYWDSFTPGARYIRAVSPTGQTGADWPGGAGVLVSGATSVGGFVNLVKVNGHPAMAYYENAVGSVQFIRALTVNGAAPAEWPAASTTVDSGGNPGMYTSLAVIDGRAAVSYTASAPFPVLCYSQALDANGLTWSPRALAYADPSWTSGEYCDLIDNQGQPFIAHYNSFGHLHCSFIPAQ